MKQRKFRINWFTLFLLIAPALITADFIITLLHQPPGYGQGNFFLGTDGNPIIYLLLTSHPILFTAGYVIYVGLVAWMLKVSARPFKIILSVGLILDHSAAIFLPYVFMSWRIYHIAIYPISFLPPLLLFIGLIIFLRSKLKSPDSS